MPWIQFGTSAEAGSTRQISWASQAWAVLADIPESDQIGANVLRFAFEKKTAVITKRLISIITCVKLSSKAGLRDLAVQHILTCRGPMIGARAGTFWEAWGPKHLDISPMMCMFSRVYFAILSL